MYRHTLHMQNIAERNHNNNQGVLENLSDLVFSNFHPLVSLRFYKLMSQNTYTASNAIQFVTYLTTLSFYSLNKMDSVHKLRIQQKK